MPDILLADNLETLPGVRHAFFTRAYGNGGFYLQENPQDVFVTRGRMAGQLGVETDHLLSAYQHHSPDVVVVTEIWDANHRPKADALVTNQKGFALGILTADCVPVLFADPRGNEGAGVIGAAHAGWRGAIGGVLENTLTAMEKLGARRKSVHAALGPCIWQNSYEVGPEFPAPFLAEDPAHEKFLRRAFKSDHYMFDLGGYVSNKLRGLGVASVEPSGADTCAAPDRFYSHRYSTLKGEKRTGNLMSAIALI
jgi:YfiH family protein